MKIGRFIQPQILFHSTEHDSKKYVASLQTSFKADIAKLLSNVKKSTHVLFHIILSFLRKVDKVSWYFKIWYLGILKFHDNDDT